jgi:hypothetical protein
MPGSPSVHPWLPLGQVRIRKFKSAFSVIKLLEDDPLSNLEFKIVRVNRQHLAILVRPAQWRALFRGLNVPADRFVKARKVFPNADVYVSRVGSVGDTERLNLASSAVTGWVRTSR